MNQQPIQSGHAENEADYKAENNRIGWSHVFDWGFWVQHPLATLTFFSGGLLLSPITDFPGGNPKQLWYVALGLWIMLAVIIGWIFSGIIARMEGRELLTSSEISQRDQQFKDRLQERLGSIENDLSKTQRQLDAQQRRQISSSEKETINATLAEFKGQKFRVYVARFDPEASQYANLWTIALEKAGWEYAGTQNAIIDDRYGTVSLAISSKSEPPNVPAPCKQMFEMLKGLGLSHASQEGNDVYVFDDLDEDTVGICISPK